MNNTALLNNLFEDIADREPNTYFVCTDSFDIVYCSKIKEKYPDRVILAGISEQNAISIATGLGVSGKTVYVLMQCVYSTRRALDQLKMGCYSNANIKIIGCEAGVRAAYAGYSHLAIDDFALLANTPNLRIRTSCCYSELKKIINDTILYKGPEFIAIDTFSENFLHLINPQIGETSSILNKGMSKCCILSNGLAITDIIKFSNFEKFIKAGIDPTIISFFQVKPINENLIKKIIEENTHIVTLEYRCSGGLSASIAEYIACSGKKVKFLPIYFKNCKYNIVGNYRDYIDKYIAKEAALIDKIINFFLSSKLIFITRTGSTRDRFNNIKIKHKFCGITYLKLSKQHNRIRKKLFGFIPCK